MVTSSRKFYACMLDRVWIFSYVRNWITVHGSICCEPSTLLQVFTRIAACLHAFSASWTSLCKSVTISIPVIGFTSATPVRGSVPVLSRLDGLHVAFELTWYHSVVGWTLGWFQNGRLLLSMQVLIKGWGIMLQRAPLHSI